MLTAKGNLEKRKEKEEGLTKDLGNERLDKWAHQEDKGKSAVVKTVVKPSNLHPIIIKIIYFCTTPLQVSRQEIK